MSQKNKHVRYKKADYSNPPYRGVVVTNIDPLEQGRLLVSVPDVLGLDPCIWASPSSPLGGAGMGVYWVPPIEAGVYIAFENGDPDQAVWTGCWRGAPTDKPALANTAAPGVPVIVIGSLAQNNLAISDGPLPAAGIATMGLVLQSGVSSIVISPEGINIIAPKIQINGVTIINNGALTVAGA